MDWQPIETAPRGADDEFLGWVPQNESIYMFTGVLLEKMLANPSRFAAPTHWMPLPAPPTPMVAVLDPATGETRQARFLGELVHEQISMEDGKLVFRLNGEVVRVVEPQTSEQMNFTVKTGERSDG